MRFRILGPLEVLSPDGWAAIGATKWRSLLACLLVRPGQLVPTENLILELWGDAPPSTANNLVSIYVHQLKKLIGDTDRRILVYRAPGYVLHVAPGDVDIERFESLIAEGRTELATGDPERAAELLSEALGLWRGQLLADVPPTPLIEQHARRAAELWFVTTELRIEGDLACGRAAEVIPELRGLVMEYPLRERLWALLVRALEEGGRRAEALEVYAQAREKIADELGVDPGSELQRLYADLLAADALPRPSVPPVTRPRRPRAVTGAADTPAALGPAVRRPDHEDARSGTGGAEEPKPESPGTIAIGTFDGAAGAEAEAEAGPEAPEETAETPSTFQRPAQLPADIGDFTGRETHVEQLCSLLLAGNATRSPGAVRIVVVNGAAGLGKTTLAVHAAHEVSARFPDGQLYVDLQGASSQTASPGEVLARFLRELGVEGDKIPARDDERAALYRTTLARRRILILLDNARDAAQVRPLLPGSSSCAVLVTTRNRTADLASTRFVDLNVLDDAEALELFSRIVGKERAAAEPDATAEILVACAGLPLAIRICAARLAARRQWKIGTLASRLRDQHRRLDELTTGDLAVRASFQVSYDSIKPVSRGADPARAFRLLGLWQGTSINLQAAAALLGEPADDVAEMLESLVDANLLESPAPDWYRFHDLLRVYAMDRAQALEPKDALDEALNRLLWWYLDTAQVAADTVSPQRYQIPRDPRAPSHPPLPFATGEAALAWYDDERNNIVAATRQAAAVGLHEVASRLPSTLWPMFNRRNNWADCVTTHRVAAESATKTGNRLVEAWALNQIGFALVKLSDPEAFAHLEQALAVRQEFGDTRGEALTAICLGEGHLRMHGAGEDALRYLQRAADLLEPLGASPLRGAALNNLGEVYFELDDLDAAAECYMQALEISRGFSDIAEGYALLNLGRVNTRQHRPAEAIARFEEALPKVRASGALDGEAGVLQRLGAAQAELGKQAEARASLTQALRIFEQIGFKQQAAETSALLASLPARPEAANGDGAAAPDTALAH
jgi:DNA-binding SARP family transcriptional activator